MKKTGCLPVHTAKYRGTGVLCILCSKGSVIFVACREVMFMVKLYLIGISYVAAS